MAIPADPVVQPHTGPTPHQVIESDNPQGQLCSGHPTIRRGGEDPEHRGSLAVGGFVHEGLAKASGADHGGSESLQEMSTIEGHVSWCSLTMILLMFQRGTDRTRRR